MVLRLPALACACLLLLPLCGQAAQSRETPQSGPKTPPTNQQSATAAVDDVVSIERIRKELERKPSLTFTMPDPSVPRYQLRIEGNRFEMPDFLASFAIPKSPVPVPMGGTDHYEMMRLNTPHQYWGSAPFSNSDLLGMSALSGAYALLGALVKKAIDGGANRAAAHARLEVQQELAELAERNRLAASGATTVDKKTAEEKKKKEAEQKKRHEEEQ